MSVKSLILLGFVMLFDSCNNEGKTSTEINDSIPPAETATTKLDSLSSGCYTQIVAKDSSFLQIENKGNNVTGALSFAIFEKDRNDGTLQADITGDILKGWYLFRSEGVMSVREVAWKIKGDQLWPATGEMTQQNDTMKFVNPATLDFDKDRPFVKVACVL